MYNIPEPLQGLVRAKSMNEWISAYTAWSTNLYNMMPDQNFSDDIVSDKERFYYHRLNKLASKLLMKSILGTSTKELCTESINLVSIHYKWVSGRKLTKKMMLMLGINVNWVKNELFTHLYNYQLIIKKYLLLKMF